MKMKVNENLWKCAMRTEPKSFIKVKSYRCNENLLNV